MSERSVARAHEALSCPRCGRPLPSDVHHGTVLCPSCSRPFEIILFDPPQRRAFVQQLTGELPEGTAALCGNHQRNVAEHACSRCGMFMCSLCTVDADEMKLCPACYDRLSAEGALRSTRTRFRDYGGLSVAFGVFSIFMMFLGIFLGPAAVYYSIRGMRQSRESGDISRPFRSFAGFLLGLVGTALGVWFALLIAGVID